MHGIFLIDHSPQEHHGIFLLAAQPYALLSFTTGDK